MKSPHEQGLLSCHLARAVLASRRILNKYSSRKECLSSPVPSLMLLSYSDACVLLITKKYGFTRLIWIIFSFLLIYNNVFYFTF